MTIKHRKLMRWHVWLGWLIGVPIILWTATGLFMVSRPIEEVRGTNLRAETPAIAPITPMAPSLEGRSAKKLTLEQRAVGPVWIIEYVDGGQRRADPATGRLLSGVAAAEARDLAAAYYTGPAKITGVSRTSAKNPPIDLRRNRPAWRTQYDDGTRLYIDADTGSLLAVRTKFWRAFDFMWGLHIMDLQTREDTSHPILIGSTIIALLGSILGFVMLFTRRSRKKRTSD